MSIASEIRQELQPIQFRELVVEVFDTDQLDTIKTLCVNVIMQRVGFEDLLRTKANVIAEYAVSPEDLMEIRRAMLESELIIQREIIDLRRQAWDKVMAKLPEKVVNKLEGELGFGGLEKPK